MPAKSFEDLFITELSDVYSAEKQLVKALPKLAKAASSQDLQEAFQDHLEETQQQVQRIETIIKREGITLKRKKNEVMASLIEDGSDVMNSMEEGALRDAAMIMAAQKVEHYEISAYGSLVEQAKLLGFDKAVDLLNDTLEEERGADDKLNDIALSGVNEDALEMHQSV